MLLPEKTAISNVLCVVKTVLIKIWLNNKKPETLSNILNENNYHAYVICFQINQLLHKSYMCMFV